MPLIILLHTILFLNTTTEDCSHIAQIRTQFHELHTEELLEAYISTIEAAQCHLYEPYLASAIMQRAEYAFFPTTKLKHFNRGKKKLEQYIAMHPQRIEARFVRVLVQSSIPRFLGYKQHIDSDIKYIETHIEESPLPATFKAVILKELADLAQD